MKRQLASLVFCVMFLAACGSGDDDSSADAKAAENPAGTAGLAGAFQTELTAIKDCVQGAVDGKAACEIGLFENPVSRLCSDVRTGRANTFAGADYTKFEATCTAWSDVLSSTNEARLPKLTAMIEALKPLAGG